MLFKTFDPLKGKQLRIMDENGKIVDEKNMPDLNDDQVVEAYKYMLYARQVDLKAVAYQRMGRLFTLPPNLGQEAAALGSAYALDKEKDWMVPAFREMAAWLYWGATAKGMYLYWAGSEDGNVTPDDVNFMPSAVPVASQVPHAAGIGYAIKYKGTDQVVITYFGDGGTSEGDFHEGMNFAGVFKLPVIFFCNNNQYAISVPRRIQSAAKKLADKAIGYGMPGIQVDGNDFFAVYAATKEAANYARGGNGPVMIEAETYRRGYHTTSDDPTKYRTAEEEAEWEVKDPLVRMKKYLEDKGLWDDDKENDYVKHAKKDISAQFKEVEEYPRTSLEQIFKYMYEEMPDILKRQKVEMEKYLAGKEGR
ncbi:MAG: pyruvate dehydrogenase (acetyl-transferring) E1 component subunit alpha [candidate division Zixibacteria bacterium]|nr:pyruvate dehydrogenase (acetyl-transferring) E1 component subunit alpha [candidate division Zixibacteria bacterium]NIR63028.1 pyruvate dehydrogenase (acetyl-transferring) E1 component subunit alpha [candidate division Zixibacteria bacterium]NIS16432.1 pyruvate dehydrogenase (acetyl-transferring) E1 component subunit alpha [candidate division Zixibacteria bacterium]NIS45041.1 pyruvate dehydrogenase (acetyl-transferring) E1 component subunit alpha [candidate division Zixibacteria bacterium]NIT